MIGNPVRLDLSSCETVPVLVCKRVGLSGDDPAVFFRRDDGTWRSSSFAEYAKDVCRVIGLLDRLGLKKGQRVAIIMGACWEWDVIEKAVHALGGVVVGVEPHASDDDLAHIVAVTKPRICVARDAKVIARLESSCAKSASLVEFAFEGFRVNGQPSDWDREANEKVALGDWASRFPAEEDVATIIFTSGTTGVPKGISFTHGQIIIACESVLNKYPEIGAQDHVVCWLPLANLFQRMMNLCAMALGAPVFFVEDPRKLIDLLPEIKPAVLIGVPRFYEKIRDKVLARADSSGPIAKRLFQTALAYRVRGIRARSRMDRLIYLNPLVRFLLDILVFTRVKNLFGGSIKFMISGSARCPVEVLEFFHAVGLPVLEAYGVSENVIPIAANSPRAFKIGSVGTVQDGNDVKISPDGELLIKGAGVFAGYYLDQGGCSRFDARGYYATGDFVDIDAEGFLTIRGRKSDFVKTTTGRKIRLSHLEGLLTKSRWIETAAVVVSGKLPVSVVELNCDAIRDAFGDTIDFPGTGHYQALSRLLIEDVARQEAAQPGYERIAGMLVVTSGFSVEGQEITRNLKLRRAAIGKKYAAEIRELYAQINELRDDTSPARAMLVRFTTRANV